MLSVITMRHIIFAAIALTLFGGIAEAQRYGDRGRDRGRDRRDHRVVRTTTTVHRGPAVRDHRGPRHYNPNRRVVTRNRVYVNNGRYHFHGGITRAYVRPVIHTRYYNYRVRPRIIVENMQPVPGYIWVGGNWSWNGFEWIWNGGHYAPDPQYSAYYDDGSWDY